MCSFPRFDLQESSYAIGLMADQTPAWREVYAEILAGLAERFLTYWAAVDWLSQFGPDPRRKSYPEEWRGFLIPEEFWGDYDAPGWVANGIAPWGLQPDPIRADGNLFFKGWLNLTQSLHSYVTDEARWEQPFLMAGVERTQFSWTQHGLVEHLVGQWQATPMGPHCENTKVWPFCLSAAGLGLKMYDNIFNRDAHSVYHQWLEHTQDKYYIKEKSGVLEAVTLYYDPLKEHFHLTTPLMGLGIAFYALPQAPAFAETLYRSAVSWAGWDNPAIDIVVPSPDPRMMALGLALAKELGDYATEARLRAYAESHFEPKHFGANDSQFGYWFKLGENWPRGQLSALALCADVGGRGAWQKLFQEPNLEKFHAPTVEGIDFPALGVAQAWNDRDKGVLQLHVYDLNHSKSGQSTTFRINRLPDPKAVKIHCDGLAFENWKITDQNEITLTSEIGSYNFQIYTGWQGAKSQKNDRTSSAKERPTRRATESHAAPLRRAHRLILPLGSGCSCCTPATV